MVTVGRPGLHQLVANLLCPFLFDLSSGRGVWYLNIPRVETNEAVGRHQPLDHRESDFEDASGLS